MAAGMGWKRIARAAGVGYSTVYPILYGKYVDNPLHPEHRPLRKQVRREVAEKLLAVRLDLAAAALVDGTGTRRRLQALVAMGWSQLRLARMIGFTQANFGTLIHGHTCVLRKTADAAVRIYSDCWRGPAVSTPREKGSVTAAKRLAASYGWAPPLAWDDDSIDDPSARPDLGEAPDGADARREDVRELLSYGDHPDSIPVRLGITPGRAQSSLLMNS